MKTTRALLIGPMIQSKLQLKQMLARALPRKQGAQTCCIAVDRGLDWAAREKLRVKLAVGDWDSIRNQALLTKIPHLTLPRDKDRSDFYYSLMAAANLGVDGIICVGFTGGLPDYQLAVLLDLTEAGGLAREVGTRLRSIQLVGPEADWFIVSDSTGIWRKKLKKNQRVSLFALGGDALGVTIQGFAYPLKNETLPPSSRGLSNQVLGTSCSVKVRQGNVLIVIPRGAQK